MNFEWDPGKESRNRRKHGVSFYEAATVFGDPLARTYDDEEHSISERRFITVGVSNASQVLVVAHAERGDNIRIISARKATSKERRIHEDQNEKDS